MRELSDHLKIFTARLQASPLLILCSAAFLLGLAGLAIGFWLALSPHSKNPAPQAQSSIEDTSQELSVGSTESATLQLDQIVVDVSGAVKKPGLYTLHSSSRIANALDAAGGLSKEADLGFIAKNLNLADKVTEGEKIYFPPIQKETDTQVSSENQISGMNNLISINSASADELDTLPGIGEKLAAKIIDGRPYQKIEELNTRVKIGESVFNKIKDAVKI